ncbi:glycosyl transferase [Zopfochytrium polystomum]|nr:glycosyl transferase [Zopfochytrium polystomum]
MKPAETTMALTWAAAACIKTLFIHAYRSTDFEVHRNWLAITHSLPISKWYYEDRSEWTLDYPPFFAWFEWFLSLFAARVDPQMLELDNLGYASTETVVFQRATVVASEAVLAFAAYRLVSRLQDSFRRQIYFALLVLNPGILFVDNIHFQYNGFLYGILVLSIAAMGEKRFLLGGALFAAVLNFKHIYLYQAPAVFFYILSAYCFVKTEKGVSFSPVNLVKIGIVTVAVFALSFGPFYQHIPQLMSRLFPFKRGLNHAYWAPNFWALYAFLDRVAIAAMRVARLDTSSLNTDSMTRGLVGNTSFAVLPDVSPLVTLIATVLTQLPIWWRVWRFPTENSFIEGLVMCGFSSYLFGWHVHEKAILVVLIPFSLIALESRTYARLFYILSVVGYFSLFPLLFAPSETPTKTIVLLLYAIVGRHYLAVGCKERNQSRLQLPILALAGYERLYLWTLPIVYIYAEIHPWLLGGRLAFLPLMLVSVVSAVGVLYVWVGLWIAMANAGNEMGGESRTEAVKRDGENQKEKAL